MILSKMFHVEQYVKTLYLQAFPGYVRIWIRELDFRAEGSKIKACLKDCIPRLLLPLGL